MKLSIVIPVYNEINTVLELLRKVKATPFDKEIIVIDDGSTDGTRQVLQEIKEENVKVIFNTHNKGKGFSLRRGFEHVTGNIVIIQDADLEYYPDEYSVLIQKIIEGKADVVYGTRFLGARRVFHFYHYLGNGLLNFIANFLFDTYLSDLMTGYKVFKSSVVKKLLLRADGFGIEAEMTGQILRRRLRVYEVPISYDGRDYDEGKKITWKDFFRCLYWLLKSKFESFDISEDTLYKVRMMKSNNRWVFEQTQNYLGKSVLEIGSGIGNISRFLISFQRNVVLTDINEAYLEYLTHRYVSNPKVKVLKHDIASDDPSKLAPLKIDTVLCTNVLEHIEEDRKALDNIYSVLEQEGRLILLVPALRMLYGSLDEKLAHFRRYDKRELIAKLKASNFSIEEIHYLNFFAAAGWFLNSRILKKKILSSAQVRLFDFFIPLLSRIERTIRIPFGLSLIVVCKKK